MNSIEARACVLAIRGHLAAAKARLLEFDERRGWAALGYGSLAEGFEKEFGVSYQHGYKVLRAAQVELVVQNHSPLGESAVLRETWVTDSGMDKLPAEQWPEVDAIARSIAQTEHRAPTASHYTQAVSQIKARYSVFQSRYFVISQWVATEKITATVGHKLVAAIDQLTPARRGDVLQLMSKFTMTCPNLVGPLGTLFGRKADNASLILPEVLTGYLGGVALAQATLTDWRRAAEEARRQHMADGLAATADVVQPVLVTIYKGDARRTVRELKKALGVAIYKVRDELCAELLKE